MAVRRALLSKPAALALALAVALVLPIAAYAQFTRGTIESGFAARAAEERAATAHLAATMLSKKVEDATLALVRLVQRDDVAAALERRDVTSVSAQLTQITGVREGIFDNTGLVDAKGATIAHAPTVVGDPAVAREIAVSGMGTPGQSARFFPGMFLKWDEAHWGAYGAVSIAVPWGSDVAVLYGMLDHRFTYALDDLSLPPGRSVVVLSAEGVVISVGGAAATGADAAWFSPSRQVETAIPGFADALQADLGSETVALAGHARDATHLTIFDRSWIVYVLDDPIAIQASVAPMTGPVVVGAGVAAAVAVALVVLLALLLARIRTQQSQLASLAVSEERLRIARDLHDLLGHGLSLIAIKSELAARLIARDPGAAERELVDITGIARHALGDVREAVVGYREPRLDGEIARAQVALRTAGVGSVVEGPIDGLPAQIDALFAWAVRESVTNVVRHSGAAMCSIRVTRGATETTLEVEDDGGGISTPMLGSGLRGLMERASAHGGTASAAPVAGRGFRVRVAVPVGTA